MSNFVQEIPPIPEGVKFYGSPVFTQGPYDVYVGRVKDDDVPHYLIFNRETQVLEDSQSQLPVAKNLAYAFSRELEKQDKEFKKEGQQASLFN